MLKFIRGKGQQPTAERQKQQRELFAFRNTIHHGFPSKPTALAWDQSLRLIAVGTASGALRVLGQPGVEFCGQQPGNIPIVKIIFLPDQGRLVTLSNDNSLHLWEINDSILEEVKSVRLEGKLKKISAWCLESASEHIILGAEGGNVYFLNLNSFSLTEDVIYQDAVMQNVPEDYKLNPGAVEAISEKPGEPDKILIGYNRGLMVLWSRAEQSVDKTYTNTQQLESVSWNEAGTKFMSSHNDGSYTIWEAGCGTTPDAEPTTIYGPFPCKAVTKLLWHEIDGENLILFSGGLPRANCSERHSVTAVQGSKHVAFDFTSKIIDFFTIDPKEPDEKGPEALVVLAEEELVVIDLRSPDWLTVKLPYLNALHASPVICSQHVSNIPVELWERLKEAGEKQVAGQYSDRTWPIDGGKLLEETAEIRDLLLTGHEDGSVRFWAAGGVAMYPIYKFTTAHLFIQDDDLGDMGGACDEDEENEWPPFRKVCSYDPCSDDPRLALKKVVLCPRTGTLVVAGTAGHVVVTKLDLEPKKKQLNATLMNIVLDRDGFVWKGHKKLSVQSEPVSLEAGFQPSAILQLHPPAAVTSLVLQADWGLLAAGTAHGLALFDYLRQKPVATKCTLNPNDLSGTGEQGISRRKSFKKSLRESFRRLRKGRSARHGEKRPAPAAPTNVTSPTQRDRRREGGDTLAASAAIPQPEAKPVERQIEARPVDGAQGSMVRCLYLARTYIISIQNTTPTLWAGTNSGTAYVFTINVPPASKRQDEDVTCLLAKEIQLKHRAPVLGIGIVDGINAPLAETAERGSEPSGPHKVIIASEEQFKIFTLPGLKPFCKFKLTAHEGSRVRRMGFALFKSSLPSEPVHSEWCLMCLTNLGDCIVLSVPDLRRQLNAAVIRPEDINGISGLSFTLYGEGFYPHSSSELQRVTLSASRITQARCKLDLPPSARPVKEEEVEESTEEEEEEEEDEEEEENRTIVAQAEDENADEEKKGEKKEGAEKSGAQVQEEVRTTSQTPPVPAPRNGPSSPLVNGDADGAGKKESTNCVEPKENGISSEEERLELSMGDITIDSVKDHLINCSTTEESKVVTEKVEVKSSTTISATESSETVVKTTSTIISSSENSVTPPTLVEN